jgi:predicted TIM-barrel fold metal-dependent hydrolase
MVAMPSTERLSMASFDTIIDSHIHILPTRRSASLVRWIKRAFPGHPSSEEVTPDDIIADITACGASRAFNFVFPLKEEETEGLNSFSRDIAGTYPMLVPFGSVHVETTRKDEVVERCLGEYGLAGIKLHPYAQRFEAFSPEFEPVFRVLEEHRRPFVVHTGFDVFYGRAQDLDYMQRILEEHPGMPVVLVHALFPRFKLAYALMETHPLLYLDMTNVPGTLRLYMDAPSEMAKQAGADEVTREIDHFEALLADFSERIMFGTDHPVGMGSVAEIYAGLDSFGLDEAVRCELVGLTAERFLREHCGSWAEPKRS